MVVLAIEGWQDHSRVNHSIIVRLMQRFHQTGNVTDRPRAGRPRKTMLREDRLFVACQITIKNVQVQLTVKGKTTPDSYTTIPKSSCAQNVVVLK
jgi:hypothetical protein